MDEKASVRLFDEQPDTFSCKKNSVTLVAVTGSKVFHACLNGQTRLRWKTDGVSFLLMSSEQLLSRITVDPNICHGKPCVRGLRYPVEFLLDLLSSDMTADQILADYPDLEPADLRAAIAYAAHLSRIKRIQPLAA
jgi:uncharacterized protein (DUF433 family)